jgi:hypothetical protein
MGRSSARELGVGHLGNDTDKLHSSCQQRILFLFYFANPFLGIAREGTDFPVSRQHMAQGGQLGLT